MRGRGAIVGVALLAGIVPSGVRAQDEPQVVGERVEAEVDSGADARIGKRLRATFERPDGLVGVDVSVRAGVVELTGTVPSASARTLAGELARQVVGSRPSRTRYKRIAPRAIASVRRS